MYPLREDAASPAAAPGQRAPRHTHATLTTPWRRRWKARAYRFTKTGLPSFLICERKGCWAGLGFFLPGWAWWGCGNDVCIVSEMPKRACLKACYCSCSPVYWSSLKWSNGDWQSNLCGHLLVLRWLRVACFRYTCFSGLLNGLNHCISPRNSVFVVMIVGFSWLQLDKYW